MTAKDLNFSFSDDDLHKVKGNEKESKDKGSDIQSLIWKRRGKRTTVTKTVNLVYSKLGALSVDECKVHTSKLKSLRNELEELNDKMIELSVVKEFYTDSEFEIQLEINEMYSEKIDGAIFAMESRINISGITVNILP